MAEKRSTSVKKVAELMRDLDFCMFTTFSEGGMYARPMSNNREVEFDGDVWFFSGADTRKVSEIKDNPHVHLSYADPKAMVFVSMSGTAKIVKDKAKKRELWQKDLERWFEDGPDGDDVVLLKVSPDTIAYWTKDGEEQLELK